MNLLVVSTWYPWPPDNGSKLRAYHLVRELARRHAVSLLTFSDGDAPGASRAAALGEICRTVQVVPAGAFDRGPLEVRRLLSPVPRAYAQAYSPEMAARVRAALAGHDVAVALEIPAAVHVPRATGVPVVFEEAELSVVRDAYLCEAARARRWRRGLTWWKHARFVRGLCARAARTTVASDTERAILEGIGCDPARLAVVPNGVDESDLEWPRGAVADRLVYPGAMAYSANRDAVDWFLADILPLVHAARPDVDFWVTGSTEGAAPLEAPPGARLTLTGHLADVRPAIAESAVCVVPLRIGGGTRLKILRSMALGTPVVSTSKGAEGLAVTPGQDILVADAPGEFAAAVLRLLADPSLRSRIAGAARALVRGRYTWTGSGARLNDVVEQARSMGKAARA